jgi:hypothetical protein
MGAMKSQTSSGHGAHPPKIATLARFGFAGLLIIALATGWDFARIRKGAGASPSTGAATARRSHGFCYLRLGQWHADARTLVAAVRYVLESDLQTNQGKPTQRFPGLELAMPTNSTSAGPKA